MKQPSRFVTQVDSRVRICKLNKVIYVLKQSPWAWLYKLGTILLSFGVRRCNFGHSLFILKRDTSIITLIVYMDDIIISCSDVTSIKEVKG